MSRRDIWAYNPDVCDGDYCPMNCDHCPKREDAQRANGDFDDDEDFGGYDEPDDSQLEMGFDPYAGAYTYDC